MSIEPFLILIESFYFIDIRPQSGYVFQRVRDVSTTDWLLSVLLVPYGIVNKLSNILSMEDEDTLSKYLRVDCKASSTQLVVKALINDTFSTLFITNTNIALDQTTSLKIYQVYDQILGVHNFEILINGALVYSTPNTKPIVLTNQAIYTSALNITSAKARIRNLYVLDLP